MSQSIECECPICMDSIDIKKNCVTTECGHCFHASCLMTSVAHNGFGCPYCRTAMAEVPNEEDNEDNYIDDEDDEDEMFSDYSLRGFRFFFNNLNGEENDNEDNLEEDEDNEDGENYEDEDDDEPPKPSLEFITQRLLEQGITMEKLIKSCLLNHEEYEEEENFEMADREIFGKLRTIISNFTPNPIQGPSPEVIPPLDIC